MGAKDDTEEVLKKIHLLFSRAVPVGDSKKKVIVDKEEAMDLLKELNSCMDEMLEEYELNEAGHDRAEREMKKKGEKAAAEAKRDANDIYAASMMYTEHALKEVQETMAAAETDLDDLVMRLKSSIQGSREKVHDNQLEVLGTLQDMVDGDKYMRLIQDENLRLQKEKEDKHAIEGPDPDEPDYAARKTEIHINEAYIKKTEDKR